MAAARYKPSRTHKKSRTKPVIIGCAIGAGILGFFVVVFIIFFIANVDFDTQPAISEEFKIENTSGDPSEIIESSYNWTFIDSRLNRRHCSLTFELLQDEVDEAAQYIDRLANTTFQDLGVDESLANTDPLNFQYHLWTEIFKRVYNQGYPHFDEIVAGFKTIFKDEQLSEADKIKFVVTFIQQMKYQRPGGALDLLAPMHTLAARYGDCDTKSLLLYVIFEKMGIDCVMLWSYQYRHAMLGIEYGRRGTTVTHRGKRFFFVETTYPGWEIGQLPPEVKNKNYWYTMDIDGNTKPVNNNRNQSEEESDSQRAGKAG